MSAKMGVCSECGESPREIHHHHPKTRKPICSTCYHKLKAERELKPEEARKRFLSLSNDEAARWFIEEANPSDFDILLGSAETKSKAEWIFELISKTAVAKERFIKHLQQVGFGEEEVRSLIKI